MCQYCGVWLVKGHFDIVKMRLLALHSPSNIGEHSSSST